MDPFEAFKLGYRHAYLCLRDLEEPNYNYLISKNLPFTTVAHRSYLFFRQDQDCHAFNRRIQSWTRNDSEFHRIIGLTLGFPPIAVEFFVNALNNPDLEDKRAGFKYPGYEFAGHVDQSKEICRWLWSNIDIPVSPVKMTYQGDKFLLLPTGDQDVIMKPKVKTHGHL